jgi:Zn-dependent M28 family amino/carboxypeptidase
LNAALATKELDVRNVVGLLEAAHEEKKDEILIIGAHFDHIGRGEFGSLSGAKGKGKIHNGADDNASGTSALMEIAGFLASQTLELKRDVLFIGFTAEEMGLLGARHYVDSPALPIAKTAAMVNLDMVSYLGKTGHLEIFGANTSPTFEDLLKKANRSTRIKLNVKKGMAGNSDHYPFYKKGLPVLFFITGLHKNYHRPSDDYKAMDKRGFEKVARYAGEVALTLANLDTKPVFVPASKGGLETGPYLGISIEGRDGNEVYISEVAKGSPAARGGLKKNDRLLEANDQEVSSVSLFYGIWSGVRPGSKVSFLIRRDGRMRMLRVQLKT